jgi:DivIVA domain-containing protein
MELTAKTLQDVTFGAKVRGYDPAEVDVFIAAVAEGVEELQERLRRATERATRAEQQVATAGEAGAAAPAAAASSTGEISKVWERAVAAAESAVAEAKEEAESLLKDARERASRQLEEATEQVRRQLSDARYEADSTVQRSREEAARIANEAQGQLRVEITHLEGARSQLKSDVDSLAGFLEGEKSRLRDAVVSSLAAIDAYGSSGGSGAPSVATVDVPEASAPMTPADFGSDTSSWGTTVEPEEQQRDERSWEGTPQSGAQEQGESQHVGDAGGWGEPAWSAPSERAERAEWEDVKEPAVAAAAEDQLPEEEGDPFLAELRRAVQDEGPLGPRDEEEDDSISSLYADESDDGSGFFRKKK